MTFTRTITVLLALYASCACAQTNPARPADFDKTQIATQRRQGPSDYFLKVLHEQRASNPESGADPNDCANRTVVCGNGTLNYNSLGDGVDEFPNGIDCLSDGEHQSTWFEINISSTGTLAFDIEPIAGFGEDYDFAIWGPSPNCNNLGNPIRCSYADQFCSFCPKTGLGNGTNDVSENQWGNGYVREINATVGDTYYILVDNWNSSSSGFDLTWTGTAGLGNIEIDPLPETVACLGGQVLLDPNYNGNGNTDYTWTADPSSALAYLDNPNNRTPLVTIPDDYTGGPITYSVDVTENSCFGSTEVVVDVREISLEAEVFDASCSLPIGGFDISVQDGTPPYSVSWSSGASTEDLADIIDGTYTVLLTDQVGCTAEGTYTLVNTPPPLLALAAPPVSCGSFTLPIPQGNNLPSNTAYFTGTNGTGTRYEPGDELTSSQTLYVFANGGTNCSDEGSISITVNQPSTTTISQAICFTDSIEINGTFYGANRPLGTETLIGGNSVGCDSIINIALNVSTAAENRIEQTLCEQEETTINGTLYSFANPTGTEVLENASFTGCDSIITVDLSFYNPNTSPFCYFETGLSGAEIACYGGTTGALEIVVLNGEPPYPYTWENMETGLSGTGILTANNSPEIIEGLPAGFYEVYVEQTAYAAEIKSAFTIEEPSQLLVNESISNYNGWAVPCKNDQTGSIQIDLNGGTNPYSVYWENGQTGAILNNLAAGTYAYTVTDGNGCDYENTLELNAPDFLDMDITAIPEPCFGDGGSILIDTVLGGVSPYRFIVDSGLFMQQNEIAALSAGLHQITLIDANNCRVESDFSILPAPPFQFEAGRDTAILSGDSVLYWFVANKPLDTVLWSPAVGISFLEKDKYHVGPLSTQQYELTAIDENGCEATDRLFVYVELERDIYAPNIINLSDAAGQNGSFTIFSGRGVDAIQSLQIYDRWGALIHQAEEMPPNDLQQGWRGTHANGKTVDTGLYIYQAVLRMTDGRTLPVKGDITVLR